MEVSGVWSDMVVPSDKSLQLLHVGPTWATNPTANPTPVTA